MELTYTFEGKKHPVEYEYEISTYELEEFLEDEIGLDRLVDNAKSTFSDMEDEKKQSIIDSLKDDDDFYDNNGINWPVLIDNDISWCIDEGLIDLSLFEDELYDYFKQDAKEAWIDTTADESPFGGYVPSW